MNDHPYTADHAETQQTEPRRRVNNARAVQLWNAGNPIAGTPAEIYLASRKIMPAGDMSDTLRYQTDDNGGSMLLGAVRTWTNGTPGKAVAIQRIFLSADGKPRKWQGERKMTLGEMSDEAGEPGFWIMPGIEPAVVCEGIEDALAVRIAYFNRAQRPPTVVATLGIGRFKRAGEVFRQAIFLPDNETDPIEKATEAARVSNGKVVLLSMLKAADGCKDANELLDKAGAAIVVEAVAMAVEPPHREEKSRTETRERIDNWKPEASTSDSRPEDVERALNAYWDTDSFEDWTKAALALHSIEGGKAMWLTWAKRSKKFNAPENERKWRDTVPTSGITAKSILDRVPHDELSRWGKEHANANDQRRLKGFSIEVEDVIIGNSQQAEAEDDPFAEPKKPETEDDPFAEPKKPLHPMLRFLPYREKLHAPKFTINGFIGANVCIYAGQHGIGKTSAILPLAGIAAGLHPITCPLAIKHWRHVIYISEDVDQVFGILRAMEQGDSVYREKIMARIHVVDASRMSVEEFVRVGVTYAKLFNREVDGTILPPLVILDTKSAVFAVEDENDNAEASKIIAALKQDFSGLPIWIIGHIAKANMTRAEAATMSLRGASALEADAHQVVFFVAEGEDRYFVRGKTRFEANWKEVAVITHVVEEYTEDEFGDLVSVKLRRADFVPQSTGERLRRKEEREQQESEAARESLRKAALEAVRARREEGKNFSSRSALAEVLPGRKADKLKEVGIMVDEGWIVEATIPADRRPHSQQKTYLFDLDAEEREAFRTSGKLPDGRADLPKWVGTSGKKGKQ